MNITFRLSCHEFQRTSFLSPHNKNPFYYNIHGNKTPWKLRIHFCDIVYNMKLTNINAPDAVYISEIHHIKRMCSPWTSKMADERVLGRMREKRNGCNKTCAIRERYEPEIWDKSCENEKLLLDIARANGWMVRDAHTPQYECFWLRWLCCTEMRESSFDYFLRRVSLSFLKE